MFIVLGGAAAALIPNVSDDMDFKTAALYNSCQRVFELVPTFHYSPSTTLKEPGMPGMLLKTQ